MESNKFIIEEFGLTNSGSKHLLIKLIDDQINNCKLDYLSQWERNHSINPKPMNKKVEALQAKKREIEQFFETTKSNNNTLDVSLMIELKQTENKKELAYA